MFLHVGQARYELLSLGDPPTLAPQSAGIAGVSHRAWPQESFSIYNVLKVNERKKVNGRVHSPFPCQVKECYLKTHSQVVKQKRH